MVSSVSVNIPILCFVRIILFPDIQGKIFADFGMMISCAGQVFSLVVD
jgi:hypothetical protein